MKLYFLFVISVLLAVVVHGQTPVGKWRMVSYTQETRDGKKTDILKDFVKDYPCATSTVVAFDAVGNLTARADKCPADMQQPGLGTKWKMPSKNKIQIFLDDDDTDPVTYNLEVTGNRMRWTINYATEDATDVTQLVAEFVKS